jgi:hypothetical protein
MKSFDLVDTPISSTVFSGMLGIFVLWLLTQANDSQPRFVECHTKQAFGDGEAAIGFYPVES